ncbi:MAG: phosphogluconate dehydrogenase C-terminal domain-containing protein [Pirellulaceae bacterium]
MGAGGKMGCRLTDNLVKSPSKHELLLVEVNEAARSKIEQRGLATIDQADALARAEVVILALPDRVLGRAAESIVPQLNPSTIVMVLDPAAAWADKLPLRDDISYFVTHPCHPNVFDHFETQAERDDFFGGVHARQAIVSALMQGPEEHYAIGEDLAKEFYGPATQPSRNRRADGDPRTHYGGNVWNCLDQGSARSARRNGTHAVCLERRLRTLCSGISKSSSASPLDWLHFPLATVRS